MSELEHKGYCAINEIGCCSCGAEKGVRKRVCSFCGEYCNERDFYMYKQTEEHQDFTHTCYYCGNIWLGNGKEKPCPNCKSTLTSFRLAALTEIEEPPQQRKLETVNHPRHYTFGKYEVIDVLEDWFAGEPLLWQVGKYIARAARKGEELEDLKKAKWFLERKIAKLEAKGGK